MVTPSIGSIGSVVLIPFPFSNLSDTKLRPTLVIASSGRDDWVCVQITSNPYSDKLAVELVDSNFQVGSLRKPSFIRPGKLFTANQSLFRRVVGKITDNKLNEVRAAIIALLEGK